MYSVSYRLMSKSILVESMCMSIHLLSRIFIKLAFIEGNKYSSKYGGREGGREGERRPNHYGT